MRYVVGFVLAVGSVALPRDVGAQADEQGGSPEPKQEEPVTSPASDSEVPDIDALSQRALDRYEIRYDNAPAKVGVKGPRTALGVFAGIGVLSIALSGGWIACVNHNESPSLAELFPAECNPLLGLGFALGLTSAVGMITSGVILGARKRTLRQLERAQGAQLRRVQWDLGRSGLVF
jgi:hypothetical protein